jgi:pimeloyl-ACP methyl ester carboxylesterase
VWPGASERYVRTNGVSLHVVESGPRRGPLVVLLHGFPDFSYGWRKQAPALAAAGFRVLVPDQRGYTTSDKPKAVSDYALPKLAADVVGLIDEAGQERAFVVGHDWGAAVAWWLALTRPERVERAAVLNVPHPTVMRRHVLTNPRQALRSWYVFFVQLPWLPERLLARDDHALLAGALRGSRRGAFTRADVERYRAAWAEPGALTAMLNWYRAAVRAPGSLSSGRVRVPLLLLWGARDAFLGRELVEPSAARCDDARVVVYDKASHWVQLDEPEAVNDELVRFFRGRAARRRAAAV